MKIGIVSDIHCNVQAFQAALSQLGDVEELFCAGDSVYGYRWSNEVVALLRERNAHTVIGNHDYDFLKIHRERDGANGHITPENYDFITALPRSYRVEMSGRSIYMVHASPFEPPGEYIYPKTPRFKDLGRVDADLFIYGHTHTAVAEQLGRVLVVNPGSVGESRDIYTHALTFAVVDLASMETEIRVVDFLSGD